jgi:hypothetical protein
MSNSVIDVAHGYETEAQEHLQASAESPTTEWAMVEAMRAQAKATLYLGNAVEALYGVLDRG